MTKDEIMRMLREDSLRQDIFELLEKHGWNKEMLVALLHEHEIVSDCADRIADIIVKTHMTPEDVANQPKEAWPEIIAFANKAIAEKNATLDVDGEDNRPWNNVALYVIPCKDIIYLSIGHYLFYCIHTRDRKVWREDNRLLSLDASEVTKIEFSYDFIWEYELDGDCE